MDFCRRGSGHECTEQALDVQGTARDLSTRFHPTPTRCSAGGALQRCTAAQYDTATANGYAATANDNAATDNTTPNDPATTDHTATANTSELKIRPIKSCKLNSVAKTDSIIVCPLEMNALIIMDVL